MSFEARRLRAQIPCGPVTIIDCGGTICHYQTAGCGLTIHCGFPTIWGCGIIQTQWCRVGTIVPCLWGSPDPCGYGSPVIEGTPEVLCAGSEEIQRRIIVDVADLPTLREQLETKLKQVTEAEEQARKQEA